MKSSLPLLGLIVVTGSLTFAADAAAENAPKFGALPSGTVTQHPVGKAPTSIPAGEKVDGFFVASPSKQMAKGRNEFLMVFSNEQEATEFAQSKGFGGRGEGLDGVCFSERVERDMFSSTDATTAAEWSVSLEPSVTIMPQFHPSLDKKGEPKRAFEVTAIHQERFVETAGKASIEMIDAWVDPTTKGVRLIGKGSLPLAKMTSTPGGFTVYAARDRTNVQFITRKPAAPPKGQSKPPSSMKDFRAQRMQQMPLVMELPSGMNDASQCSFARLALRAQSGVAEMGSIETSVVFENPPEPPPVAPKDSPLGNLLGSTHDAKADDGPEMRLRPLKISVSSSWTSKDKEPVISVSLGWSGREHKM